MKRVWLMAALPLVVCLVGLGYEAGRARAAGIPQTGAMAYSGSLLTFGAVATGTHTMSIALYVTGSSTAVCSSVPAIFTVTNGQFTIPVPDTCVPFVHANPNMQVEVTVDGVALGLTSLTAVPYTVEADTASNPAPGSAIAALAPPGTVIAYAGNPSSTPPTGWLYCNGQALARTGTYANLYAVIGNSYGTPNSSSFNVPDFRGYFLRGWDNGTGRDPDAASRGAMATGASTGNALGSVQGYAYQTHNHTASVSDPGHSHSYANGGSVLAQSPNNCPSGGFAGGGAYGPCTGYAGGITASVTGVSVSVSNNGTSAETRPLNAYVAYLIKY